MMFRRTVLVLVFSFLIAAAWAQPTLEWQHPLGGSGVDCSYSILETADGGFISLGHSESTDDDVTGNHGNLDYWVTKLDKNGALQWQRSYGGSQSEEAYNIKATSDGGYILAGFSYSADGQVKGHHGNTSHTDSWIVKIDSKGNIEWEHSYGGTGDDLAYSICEKKGGGYIFAGYSTSTDGDITSNNAAANGQSDVWVVSIDPLGNILWQQTYGGTLEDEGFCIDETTDGSFIFCAYTASSDGDITFSHGGADAWVVKIDASGKILWQKTFGGSREDDAYSIEGTRDGGYIVTGATNSDDGDISLAHGMDDIWVFKLDASGGLVWSKAYGGSSGEWAYCVHQTKDGGYIFCGDTMSGDDEVTGYHTDGDWDAWIVKLTPAGDIEWEHAYGGSSRDEAYDVKETSDGGFVFTGSALSDDGDVVGHHGIPYVSDFWVLKLKPKVQAPEVAGFNSVPATLSCISSLDSIHIHFRSPGSYEITAIDISGADKNNFTPALSLPIDLTLTDAADIPVPITFTPSPGTSTRIYSANADVTIRNTALGATYTFSIPLAAYSVERITMNLDAHFVNPVAHAGDEVILPIFLTHEPKNFPVPLAALAILELHFDLQYNTDLLMIAGNDVASAFSVGLAGWIIDPVRSFVDEKSNTLHLVLRGNSPLDDTTSFIGSLALQAVLTLHDSVTALRLSSASIITASGAEVIGSCGTVTAVTDSAFTEIPACGDDLLKGMMRGEELRPFRITSISPNPANDKITIGVLSGASGTSTLKIFNETGSQISRREIYFTRGSTEITIQTSNLPEGVYTVMIAATEIARFVKMK